MAAPRWPVSVKGVLTWHDEVLLVHNERDEWELPGGRLEHGESPAECVIREITEEVAVVADVAALIDVWTYEVLPGQFVLIVTYGCVAPQPAELRHSAEHDGVMLAPIAELDRLRMPDGYRQSIRSWRRWQDGGRT
jgi:8-oxo-dGTP pyrophosphatase MutT (NUDIX family)